MRENCCVSLVGLDFLVYLTRSIQSKSWSWSHIFQIGSDKSHFLTKTQSFTLVFYSSSLKRTTSSLSNHDMQEQQHPQNSRFVKFDEGSDDHKLC